MLLSVVTVALISSEEGIPQYLANGRLRANFVEVGGPWVWSPNDDVSFGCLGGSCVGAFVCFSNARD